MIKIETVISTNPKYWRCSMKSSSTKGDQKQPWLNLIDSSPSLMTTATMLYLKTSATTLSLLSLGCKTPLKNWWEDHKLIKDIAPSKPHQEMLFKILSLESLTSMTPIEAVFSTSQKSLNCWTRSCSIKGDQRPPGLNLTGSLPSLMTMGTELYLFKSAEDSSDDSWWRLTDPHPQW